MTKMKTFKAQKAMLYASDLMSNLRMKSQCYSVPLRSGVDSHVLRLKFYTALVAGDTALNSHAVHICPHSQ